MGSYKNSHIIAVDFMEENFFHGRDICVRNLTGRTSTFAEDEMTSAQLLCSTTQDTRQGSMVVGQL